MRKARPSAESVVGPEQLGRFSANPGPSYWNCMKHVMRHLQHTKNIGIEYNGDIPFNFHGYSDSDGAEDKGTRRSTSGNVFLIAGGAISWASKRQATLLRELEQHYIDPDERNALLAIALYGDNTGSNDLTRNPEHHQRTKHIDVIYHFTRERIESNEISVEYITRGDMTAGILTKSLAHVKHKHHMDWMGLFSGFM